MRGSVPCIVFIDDVHGATLSTVEETDVRRELELAAAKIAAEATDLNILLGQSHIEKRLQAVALHIHLFLSLLILKLSRLDAAYNDSEAVAQHRRCAHRNREYGRGQTMSFSRKLWLIWIACKRWRGREKKKKEKERVYAAVEG